jgi:hypothetical protein
LLQTNKSAWKIVKQTGVAYQAALGQAVPQLIRWTDREWPCLG